MTILEIIGAGALYIAGTVAILYLAMFLMGRMKGGLEVVALMTQVAVLIVVVSAAGGLVLLGGLLL